MLYFLKTRDVLFPKNYVQLYVSFANGKKRNALCTEMPSEMNSRFTPQTRRGIFGGMGRGTEWVAAPCQ
jgi:hypothetical protein